MKDEDSNIKQRFQPSREQILKDYAQYRPKKEVFQDEYPRHTVEITKPFLMSTTASLA
ncbi:MAG: hypothetical protein LW724_19970 [Planctomycetaceae bacterium]|nr:hypothetical protein [Planctomycetaceae bacterium]